jgi:hypothetical protein
MMKVLTYTNLKTNYKITMKHVKLFEDFVREGKFDKPIKLSVKKSRKNPYTFSHKMDNDELYKLFFIAMGKEVADKEELDGYKDTDYKKARIDIFNIMMSRGANPYRDKRTWADDWEEEEYDIDEQFINEKRVNRSDLKELQDDYGYEAELDGDTIYVTGENPWEDDHEYTFSWDGENAYCGTDISDSEYTEPVTSANAFAQAISDTDNWE